MALLQINHDESCTQTPAILNPLISANYHPLINPPKAHVARTDHILEVKWLHGHSGGLARRKTSAAAKRPPKRAVFSQERWAQEMQIPLEHLKEAIRLLQDLNLASPARSHQWRIKAWTPQDLDLVSRSSPGHFWCQKRKNAVAFITCFGGVPFLVLNGLESKSPWSWRTRCTLDRQPRRLRTTTAINVQAPLLRSIVRVPPLAARSSFSCIDCGQIAILNCVASTALAITST